MIKDDPEIVRLTLEGKTRHQIAEEMGITPAIVDHSRKRTGVMSHAPVEARGGRPRSYTPEDEARVAELTRAGVPAKRIEQLTGVSASLVYKIRKERGYATPRADKFLAPFEERLKQAREMLDDGASFAEVKRTAHVGRDVLRREFPGRSWTREQCVDFAVAVRQANRQMRKNGLDIRSRDL